MSAMPPVICTSTAQMGDKDHILAGHEVFGTLLGTETLTGLLGMSVGLPRLSREDVALLDDLATVNALCDARIWPVKAARLAASYGSDLHGFCAGNLMHANSIIGAGPCQRGAELLVELMAAIGGAAGLEDEGRVHGCIDAIVARERWPRGPAAPGEEAPP